MMRSCGRDFQVHSSALLVSLSGLKVGNNVFIGANTVIMGLGLQIDDGVLIGPNCVIVSGNHTKKNGSYRFGPSARGTVIIESGSWVAANCTIVDGAILLKGSLLGAGSVLNKPFKETDSIYAGIPAKKIKEA